MFARRSMSLSSERATGHRRPHDSHHSQSVWEFGLPAIPNNEPLAPTALTWNRNTTLREVVRRQRPAEPGHHGPQWLSRRPAIGRTPVGPAQEKTALPQASPGSDFLPSMPSMALVYP